MFGRQKLAALGAEFLGAAVLSTVVLSMAGRTSFPFFAAVAAGLVYAAMILVFGNISGSHLNPIVTLGMWTLRKIETVTAILYIGMQLLGGVAAWQLAEYLLNQPLQNVAGADLDWRVFTAEAVGAFVFGLIVVAAASKRYEGGRLAALTGIGLSLGMMVASLAANGLINPVVAIGLQSWSWAYVLAPAVGALVGFNLYHYVFAPLENPVVKARIKTVTTKTAARSTKKTTARKTVKKPARRTNKK
jgi:glycerol uptake facilitator-like aquaporin